jgi:hypothetical protein
MIVDRRTFLVKPGHEAEVVDLIKGAIEGNTPFTNSYRIYMPDIGPYGVVAVEWEYKDLQEMRAAWAAWEASPDIAQFWEQWHMLTERGGGGEIWKLAAQR